MCSLDFRMYLEIGNRFLLIHFNNQSRTATSTLSCSTAPGASLMLCASAWSHPEGKTPLSLESTFYKVKTVTCSAQTYITELWPWSTLVDALEYGWPHLATHGVHHDDPMSMQRHHHYMWP